MDQWMLTAAHYLQHGTDEDTVRLRRADDCMAWYSHALIRRVGTGRCPHTKHSPLAVIYQDLLHGWLIAERARPITMRGATFGEWVRWYELHIMPTWNHEKGDA